MIRIEIPQGYVINANHRLHWAKKARMTAGIRTMAFLAGRDWKRENGTFERKVNVIAHLHFPDSRRRDPNNWAPTTKAAIDGLVQAGVFVDDSAQYIDGPDHRTGELGERGSLGITFTFAEVGS